MEQAKLALASDPLSGCAHAMYAFAINTHFVHPSHGVVCQLTGFHCASEQAGECVEIANAHAQTIAAAAIENSDAPAIARGYRAPFRQAEHCKTKPRKSTHCLASLAASIASTIESSCFSAVASSSLTGS